MMKKIRLGEMYDVQAEGLQKIHSNPTARKTQSLYKETGG